VTDQPAADVLSLHTQIVDASTILAVVVAVVTLLWAWRGDQIIAAATRAHSTNADEHNKTLHAIRAAAPGIVPLLGASVPALPVYWRSATAVWDASQGCQAHFCWQAMDFAASLYFVAAVSMTVLAVATVGIAGRLCFMVRRELRHGGRF